MANTLLEKAKGYVSKKKSARIWNKEEIELAVAWTNSEVNSPQVLFALGLRTGSPYGFVASALRQKNSAKK